MIIIQKTPIEIEKIICDDYLTNSYSSRKLSKKYNLSKATILRILKRNNIEAKNRRLVNNNLNINYFEKIDTEQKAYFLGFIFADGCVSNEELFIDINEKDIDILVKFKETINSQAKISTRIKGNSIMSRVVIKNKIFTSHLSKYGIVENKTKRTNHLPYKIIPRDMWRHFLRGLIDGDGWIIKTERKRYHIGYVTQYETTASDFIYIVNELIDDKWKNKIINRDSRYAVIQIQKYNQVKQLASVLYTNSNIYLDRKFQIAQEILKS